MIGDHKLNDQCAMGQKLLDPQLLHLTLFNFKVALREEHFMLKIGK